MKLGELRAAIRKQDGNPFIRVRLGPEVPFINFVLQKKPLYEALDAAYPEGKGQETGLTLDASNGMMTAEVNEITVYADEFTLVGKDDEEDLLI